VAPGRRGAGELAALIAQGAVSSREVVEAHLARIAEVIPHLNAIAVVLAEQARAAAAEADSNQGPRGPLYGVPFTGGGRRGPLGLATPVEVAVAV
jgi:Asp-tRNA(Asn)/Glu-tRNA(Gln) amidotransferase A subunit family amidase